MKRRIGMGFLCLALSVVLCGAVADTPVEPYGIVFTHGLEEMADLREGPSDDAALIASYFSGVRYELPDSAYIESDGWVYVMIESLQNGYMRKEFLGELAEVNEVGTPYPTALEMGTIRVPDGEESVTFRGWFSFGFAHASLYDGTRAKLLGVSEEGNWHVNVGNANGYIEGKYIERHEAPGDLFYGFIPEGYAVITDPSIGSGELPPYPAALNTLLWNSENTSDLLHRTFPFYSISDQEAQIGYAYYQGFLPLDSLAVYPLSDLFIDGEAVSDGAYVAGQDMLPGLYTLTATAGQSGLLETEIGGVKRAYHPEGEDAYTVHIPEGMQLTLENGTLCPTPQTPLFTPDNSSFSGNGRLFIYPDFGSTFSVTALEGVEHARYTRSSLLYDAGEAEVLQEITLEPGEASGILLFPGEFIEFENCIVQAEFANG